jgi:hypothetical protein
VVIEKAAKQRQGRWRGSLILEPSLFKNKGILPGDGYAASGTMPNHPIESQDASVLLIMLRIPSNTLLDEKVAGQEIAHDPINHA